MFVKALQVCFRLSIYDDPMEALTRLKQTTFVATYKEAQFEILSNRLKGLSKRHEFCYFLSGLHDEIRLSIRILILRYFWAGQDSRKVHLVIKEVMEKQW